MKRTKRSPLFRDQEPDVYVIDTSAWINIDARPDCDIAWAVVTALIQKGRIVACAAVLNELRENPFFPRRLKPYADALQAGERGSEDPEYLRHVGYITHKFPGMSKARGPKTPADPYVVALADLEKYVVVVDETPKKKPNRKIPGVCDHLGIRWMPSEEFIALHLRTATA